MWGEKDCGVTKNCHLLQESAENNKTDNDFRKEKIEVRVGTTQYGKWFYWNHVPTVYNAQPVAKQILDGRKILGMITEGILEKTKGKLTPKRKELMQKRSVKTEVFVEKTECKNGSICGKNGV